jgi:hypothetical protein
MTDGGAKVAGYRPATRRPPNDRQHRRTGQRASEAFRHSPKLAPHGACRLIPSLSPKFWHRFSDVVTPTQCHRGPSDGFSQSFRSRILKLDGLGALIPQRSGRFFCAGPQPCTGTCGVPMQGVPHDDFAATLPHAKSSVVAARCLVRTAHPLLADGQDLVTGDLR